MCPHPKSQIGRPIGTKLVRQYSRKIRNSQSWTLESWQYDKDARSSEILWHFFELLRAPGFEAEWCNRSRFLEFQQGYVEEFGWERAWEQREKQHVSQTGRFPVEFTEIAELESLPLRRYRVDFSTKIAHERGPGMRHVWRYQASGFGGYYPVSVGAQLDQSAVLNEGGWQIKSAYLRTRNEADAYFAKKRNVALHRLLDLRTREVLRGYAFPEKEEKVEGSFLRRLFGSPKITLRYV